MIWLIECDMTHSHATWLIHVAQLLYKCDITLRLLCNSVRGLFSHFISRKIHSFFLSLCLETWPSKKELYSFIFNKSAPEVAALLPIYFESRVFIENWKWVSKGCGSYLIWLSAHQLCSNWLIFSFGVVKGSTVNYAKTVNSSATTEKGGATTESRRRLELCVCI